MKISIEKLVSFYDTAEEQDAHAHVSAITGMVGEALAFGLLKHYFLNDYAAKHVELLPDKPREILPLGVNKNKGKRLDGWLCVEQDGEVIFYQTEVKNWSAHSIAGYRNRKLGLTCDIESLRSFANDKFINQWNISNQNFSEGLHYVSKVLKKMEDPKSESFRPGLTKISPLICYWYPIAPKESFKHFFTQKCVGVFNEISFFSMSLYLRDLYTRQVETIEIDVPTIETRLSYLGTMFR